MFLTFAIFALVWVKINIFMIFLCSGIKVINKHNFDSRDFCTYLRAIAKFSQPKFQECFWWNYGNVWKADNWKIQLNLVESQWEIVTYLVRFWMEIFKEFPGFSVEGCFRHFQGNAKMLRKTWFSQKVSFCWCSCLRFKYTDDFSIVYDIGFHCLRFFFEVKFNLLSIQV